MRGKKDHLCILPVKKVLQDVQLSAPKVTTEAALGLIGGTMGLLTGFSILSGVEIIYYLLRFKFFQLSKFLTIVSVECIGLLLRFFMSLRVPKAEVVSATKKRFENHLMTKT